MVLTWQLLAHHGSYVGAESISNAQTSTAATIGTEVSIWYCLSPSFSLSYQYQNVVCKFL